MNVYESLEHQACEDGMDIIYRDFEGTRLKGLYCDGNIALKSNMNTVERACVLAEELGHHYTTTGNILDQSKVENRKQERHARIWAYNKRIGLSGIVRAYQNHCRNKHEVAEFLEVTDEFLDETLSAYKSKYGTCVEVDNYVIFFEPYIAVMERFPVG